MLCTTASLLLLFSNCKGILGSHKIKSEPDTTSSAFTWQVDTLGPEGGILHDVAVINDTLAYAVGSISTKDSVYNLARWNGKSWSFFTLKGSSPGYGTAIFANNANDIWVAAGSIFHFNGLDWTVFYNTGAEGANKIWESSDDNQLYFIGNNGTITYSPDQGKTWQKVQTGTGLPFQDIWGEGGQVLALASDKFFTGGKYLVRLKGNTAIHLSTAIPAASLSGIWFVANEKYFLVGDGIYEKSKLDDFNWSLDPFRSVFKYYPFAVRGNGVNDVMVAGGYGSIAHYNGMKWKKYDVSVPSAVTDVLYSISMKSNLAIAVGYRYVSVQNNGMDYGLVYVGRRVK